MGGIKPRRAKLPNTPIIVYSLPIVLAASIFNL